ncbi:MAG: PAS domain S-box protein [Candidatus Thorarchaeota archaeon]
MKHNGTSEDSIEIHNPRIEHEAILEALSDAIHVIDGNMVIAFQNAAFSTWLEKLHLDSNITGKRISDAFPFISNDVIREYQDVFATGVVHTSSEENLISGKSVFTEVTKIPLITNGSVQQIVTVIRDVTKQHLSQSAIQISEERYRLLIENLADALFLTDTTGNITFAGEKAKELFGFTPEELVEMHFSNLLHPNMKDTIIEVFRKRLETLEDNKEGFEAIGLRKDGSSFNFHIANTIRFENGKAVGYQSLIRDITERKKTEQALHDERDRAQMYLDVAGVMLVALDHDGNIQLLNQKGLEILGYEEEEVMGRNWFDLVIPMEDYIRTIDVFRRIMNGEVQLEDTFENLVITKSGESRLIAWNNKAVTNKEGVIIGTMSSGTDITDMRKAEDELKASEHHLKMIYDTILDGIIITDANLNITSCNPAAEKLLGYSNEELVGKSYRMIIDERMFETEKAEDREKELFRNGFLDQEEYTFKRKNGEVFPTSFSAALLKDENGEIKGILGSIRDTTEMKKANEELLAEKEKYQVLFNAAPIAIGVSREDGEILDINWSMLEMLGYPEDEFKQKSALEVYTAPSDRERIRRMLNSEGKVRDFDAKMLRKDKREIDVLLNVDYVHYEGSIARLSTMRDISELNKTRRDLEQARARAEFFNDLMAHDINNVHQGILVGAELLLREEALPPEIIRYSEAIRDQVSRGIQLIENVRKLSKMEAEEEPSLQPLDLHSVMANAILLVQHAFPEKEIKIDIKFKPEEVIVLADEFLIDLFYNLVHNALKFDIGKETAIDIIVETSKSPDFVRVAIVDKGPGIPDERKDDLFSRLEKGRTLGSGMGLTLVKRIAERYNGKTWVEDRIPGTHTMGAKFVVELPKQNE